MISNRRLMHFYSKTAVSVHERNTLREETFAEKILAKLISRNLSLQFYHKITTFDYAKFFLNKLNPKKKKKKKKKKKSEFFLTQLSHKIKCI